MAEWEAPGLCLHTQTTALAEAVSSGTLQSVEALQHPEKVLGSEVWLILVDFSSEIQLSVLAVRLHPAAWQAACNCSGAACPQLVPARVGKRALPSQYQGSVL